MDLNEAVRKARKELGLSQGKLAELAGIERKQLSVLENGGNVTLATVRKVLDHLPNIEPFTLGGSGPAVTRIPTPEEQAQAMEAAMRTLGSMLKTMGAMFHGRLPTAEEANEVEATTRMLNQVFGLTPQSHERELQTKAADQPPQHLLTPQNAAEAIAALTQATKVTPEQIATLTAAAKEAEATLAAEGFLPPEKPEEDGETNEQPLAEK